jgi:centrin-2
VFDTLDTDGSGAIGVEELVDPFLALGIADSLQHVQAMVDRVDDDGSGEIEFKEFLRIVKGDENDPNSKRIMSFFKDMFTGKFGDKQVSFPVLVQQIKRESMMDSLSSPNKEKKSYGNKILKNIEAFMKEKRQKEREAAARFR